jgi:hypothetical protein
MSLVIQLASLGQIALSLWAGKYSYIAISHLQKYEDTSKKAAQYSGTAEHELHKTRTTEASGALTVSIPNFS